MHFTQWTLSVCIAKTLFLALDSVRMTRTSVSLLFLSVSCWENTIFPRGIKGSERKSLQNEQNFPFRQLSLEDMSPLKDPPQLLFWLEILDFPSVSVLMPMVTRRIRDVYPMGSPTTATTGRGFLSFITLIKAEKKIDI